MGFMDSLAANPRGGIYGLSNRRREDDDVLSLVNKLKDREMQDYMTKANFNSDLSIRQGMRERELFNPAQISGNQTGVINNLGTLPRTPEQQLELQQRAMQPQLDLAKLDINQRAKSGQDKLDLVAGKQALDAQRNQQINEDRDLDRQRKEDEANRRIALAERTLNDRTATAEAHIAARKAIAEAMEERHKLALEQKDKHFQVTSELQNRRISELEEATRQRGNQETTVEVNPDGTKETTTIRRGSSAENVQVIDRYGRKMTIPKDKLDDPNEQRIYGWKLVGGGVE